MQTVETMALTKAHIFSEEERQAIFAGLQMLRGDPNADEKLKQAAAAALTGWC